MIWITKAKTEIAEIHSPNKTAIPEANIGIVGHVDHGKTTLTYMLTGKFTDEHSEELKRGISIRLGYADMNIYKCEKCAKENTTGFMTMPKCLSHQTDNEHQRTISFVDLPGHETLLATVLTGASLMDGAILVVAANEVCPQPQTAEHLVALDIAGIKNIIIVQNKIDLVTPEQALENYKQIKAFVKGTVAENAPIIPVSAQHRANIDVLLKAIQEIIPTPKRDPKVQPKMLIARSFDINKPGTSIPKLIGGILGGSLIQGILKVGDEIEIKPGIKQGEKWIPIKTKITSLNQGGSLFQEGHPGGLLAIGTPLDPYLTKADNLVGAVVGLPGKTPPVWNKIKLEIKIIERQIDKSLAVKQIFEKDSLLMNTGTARTVGVCGKIGKTPEFVLKLPICASIGDKVALSKQIAGRWRLVGYGIIRE